MTDHSSPMRELVNQAHGVEYRALRDLEEARRTPDAVLLFEGDDGGQVYLTCPAGLVSASEEELAGLLEAIDLAAWPGNDADSRRVCYEVVPPGQAIAGGMGGGQTLDGVWLHPRLEESGWRLRVEGVLFGR